MCFVDYDKAFDRAQHEKLFNMLKKNSILTSMTSFAQKVFIEIILQR